MLRPTALPSGVSGTGRFRNRIVPSSFKISTISGWYPASIEAAIAAALADGRSELTTPGPLDTSRSSDPEPGLPAPHALVVRSSNPGYLTFPAPIRAYHLPTSTCSHHILNLESQNATALRRQQLMPISCDRASVQSTTLPLVKSQFSQNLR